eukprot:3948037-Amphidinium_carterae.1
MKHTFALGSINPVPKASDTMAAHMRVDFIDAVSNFISAKMTRAGVHQVSTILFYVMKTLLPSTKYSRLGIAKDVMKPLRNEIPQDLTQAISWLEDRIICTFICLSCSSLSLLGSSSTSLYKMLF